MFPTDSELTHFIELYSARHLTRASRQLKISQPALTQSIGRLERKLKTSLFIRSKRGCLPTPAAELLFAKANQMKSCWSEMESIVFSAEKALQGRFRVGCHPSVGAYTLPRFFTSLDRDAPGVEVRLFHDVSERITAKVIECELDLGFVVNPVRHPDLVLTKLGDDRISFWRRPKAKRIPRIVFSDLSAAELKSGFTRRELETLSDWKQVETPSLELIRTLVIRGAGIGFLPERVARADRGDLEKCEGLPSKADEIFLAYRADCLRSVAGRAIVAAARICISDAT